MPNNSVVEERVVEMRIDNAKFEAGAKKTISILEELDRSLKGLGKEHADGFDSIENSLDKVTDRFSAMGIVGDQVIRNLTNKAMELVGQLKNVATMLTTKQIDAGWSKYAEKVEAVQTIMASTNNLVGEGLDWADQEEQLAGVAEQLERLTWFADETSYSFTDMVSNVGKFTAAGRKLDESVTAMQGISAWAALSGGKPSTASRAMYNLSQALGLGAVTTIDWKSIELANMATYEFKQQAIDTAVELGKLRKVGEGVWETLGGNTVTVEKFRDTLSFGKGDTKENWFSSDVLLAVLNRYGDFAQLVKQTQDAFGYDSATYVLEDLKEYEKLLNNAGDAQKFLKETSEDLGVSLDELKYAMDQMLLPEYDLGRRAFQAAQEAKTFQEAIDATKDAVSTKWMDVFEMMFGNYLQAKELWTDLAETLWDIFAAPVDKLKQIVKSAYGVIGDESTGGIAKAVASTESFESRLNSLGKTMKDFEKAVYSVADKATIDLIENFSSVEDALKGGVISAELFKKALGALDDGYDTAKTIGLNRALNKAKKTMNDFNKALLQVADESTIETVRSFGTIEEAVKSGAISVDIFKKALESLGIDSENVVAEVEESVAIAVGSLEEMRDVALGILRGDYDNGEERRKLIEEMGLDYELMQAMAGDLKNLGEYISDEELMAAIEAYYQYNNLGERLGFSTFAEYLASATESVAQSVDEMEDLAENAENILASIYGQDILDAGGEVKHAGELFREGLKNIMTFFDDLASVADAAFLRVFGGSEDAQEAIENLGDRFFSLTAKFWEFTNAIQLTSVDEEGNIITERFDRLTNILAGLMAPIRLIGKLIGVVFRVANIGLGVVVRLLSPIMKITSTLFGLLSDGIDMLNSWIDSSSFFETIERFGNWALDKLLGPLEKLATVVEKVVDAFRKGFAEGGLTEGLEGASDALHHLLENHPILLKVFDSLQKIAGPVGTVLNFIKDALLGIGMAIAGIAGGAIYGVFTVFSKLGDWFGRVVEWASSSELLSGIWTSITEVFQKFGRVVKRVAGYAEEGYKEGGFLGAFAAVSESFERGVTRLVPHGERIIEILHNVRDAFLSLFRSKKENEEDTGVENFVERNERTLLKLEDTLDTVSSVITRGVGDEEDQQKIREGASGLVGNAWQGILDGLSKIKISDVIGAMRLMLIGGFLARINGLLDVFKEMGENIQDIPWTFKYTLEQFATTLRGVAASLRADAILKIAVAAGIIAGAIFLLHRIPQEQLTHAAAVVISIVAILTLLADRLGRVNFSALMLLRYLPVIGGLMFGFATMIIALGITITALTLVQKFGTTKLLIAVGSILVIVGLIALLIRSLVRTMKWADNDNIIGVGKILTSVGRAMIKIAFALGLIALPIIALSLLQNFGPEKFKNAVNAVLWLMAALGGVVAVIFAGIKLLNDRDLIAAGWMFTRIASAMLIVALAMQMLVLPIIELTLLQNFGPEKFKNAVNAVEGIVGYLALLIGIFSLFLAHVGDNAMYEIGRTLLRTATSMILVALAVRMMTKPIIQIAQLSKDIEDQFILRSLVYLMSAIAGIAAILVLMNRIGRFQNSDSVIKLAAAISLIALAMLFLTPVMIGMSVAMATFAGVLSTMDEGTWEKFATGLERLTKLSKTLAWFGAALFSIGIGSVAMGAGITSAALGLFLFVAAFAIVLLVLPKLVDAMSKLSEISWGEVLSIIGKIAVALIALGAVLAVVTLALNSLFRKISGPGFSNIGWKIRNTLQNMIFGMRDGVRNSFKDIIKFLGDEENRRGIITALGAMVLLAGAYVADLIPTLTHTIFGGVVVLIDSLATELETQSDVFVEAILNLVHAVLHTFASVYENIFGKEFQKSLSGAEKWIFKIIYLFAALKTFSSLINLVTPFFKLKTFLAGTGGNGGLLLTAGKTESALKKIVAAAGGLGPTLTILGALIAAMTYATKNLADQQTILENNAFEGDGRSLEDYAKAIENVQARINELQEQSKSGWTAEGGAMAEQELEAQQLLLKNLTEQYEKLLASQKNLDEQTETTERDLLGADEARAEMQEMRRTARVEKLEEEKQEIEETKEAYSGLNDFLGGFWDKIYEIDPTAMLKEGIEKQGFNADEFFNVDGSLIKEKFASAINIEELKSFFKSEIGEAAPSVGEGFEEGLPDGYSFISSAMTDMKDQAVDFFCQVLGINSPSKVFAELGVGVPEGVAQGVDDGKYLPLGGLANMMTAMVNMFNGTSQRFYNSGVAIVQGLINGIGNNFQAAFNTGRNLAISIENGFNSRLKIRSPSKVFMELAGYITQGLAMGIENSSDTAIDSIVVLGDELMQAIERSMAMVSVMADEDFTISPRITPVVDLSMARGASGALNSMFGGPNLFASVTRATNEQVGRYAAYGPASTSNQATINELHALSAQVDELNEAITNMQIVLDSGVLVGATSAKMDDRLGLLALRRGRGN